MTYFYKNKSIGETIAEIEPRVFLHETRYGMNTHYESDCCWTIFHTLKKVREHIKNRCDEKEEV